MNTKAAAVVVGVAVLGAWYLSRKAGQVAASIVTGENELTAGTVYQGAGVLGTLGAGANAASGGKLEQWGGSFGSWMWEITNSDAVARGE